MIRGRLEDMVRLFGATFVDAAETIRSRTDDPDLQRRMIVAKSRIVPAARDVLQNDNPLDGLIDLWVMSEQFRDLFEGPFGEQTLGEHAGVAREAAEQVSDAITVEVRRFVDDARFEEARTSVDKFAAANPMSADMTRTGVLPSQQPAGQRGGGLFSWVPSIDIVPFSGVGSGISEGAAAIQAFAVVADRFTNVVDSVPDRIGWELQLFEHDFAHNPAIVQANTSVATVAASAERVASSVETLPADVRREVTLALDAVDPKLAEVRQTLAEAQTTAAELTSAAEAFAATARAMEPMAAQLDTTIGTFHAMMKYLSGDVDAAGQPRPQPEPPPPGTPSERPFDILEFEQTARAITVMAAELHTTLAELRGLVAEPAIPERIDQVGDTTRQSLRAVIRDATIGAVVVLVAFFGLLLGYRELMRRRAS